ncbi:uncharacterized protein LOC128172485 [Crassostrea angulata]|uniref:uncharacterized protein LOC128172485 n=1 Tax=Magallana angulata TaxID=2784310 RepID=UPI0022B0CD2E|nr:uncharacterized protein LOC128172485 [Crassostrea angulata]
MEMFIKKSREKKKLERLENEVDILKKDIKKIKKKVHKLENKQAPENQSDAGELQLSGLNLKKYNLKNAVKGMFNAQQALNYALRELLSLEEIRNSSISGGKNCEVWRRWTQTSS